MHKIITLLTWFQWCMRLSCDFWLILISFLNPHIVCWLNLFEGEDLSSSGIKRYIGLWPKEKCESMRRSVERFDTKQCSPCSHVSQIIRSLDYPQITLRFFILFFIFHVLHILWGVGNTVYKVFFEKFRHFDYSLKYINVIYLI